MIADMHCDTIWRIWKERNQGRDCDLFQNDGHVDVKRMQDGGYILQAFALFVDKRKHESVWEQVKVLYEIYTKEMEKNGDFLREIRTKEDVENCVGAGEVGKRFAAEEQGKIGVLLTVEEGGVCEGRIERLEELYRMGVRLMTLSWNHPNELGWPAIDLAKGYKGLFQPELAKGLTPKGKEFVECMNELGMLVDVSHMSDAGFYDVLRISKRPFVASHSNARAICPCVRNLTDEMIKGLANAGGVMGLCFCPDFLMTFPEDMDNPGKMEDVVRHAKHILRVGGEDVLGLGSDFDGIPTHAQLPGVQSVDRLAGAFSKAGFTAGQIDKIMYGNVLRVIKDVL